MAEIIIAQTFLASKERLGVGDARRVDRFISKLVQDAENPGLGFEKVEAARGALWSARVNQHLRCILARRGEKIILCYVGQHDDAYDWVRRHAVEVNDTTGVLQIVVIPVLEEPAVTAADAQPNSLEHDFSADTDDFLLSLGVPLELIPIGCNLYFALGCAV